MYDNDRAAGTTLIITFICIIGIVAVIVSRANIQENRNLKTQAIERGYAIYNPTNGVWQWK